MKKSRTLFLTCFLLAVLIGLPTWSVCRQIQQERLNRNLIVAIERNDTTKVVALLNAGADANAQDTRETPVSARQVLREWWDRLNGRKPAGSVFHHSALIVASEIYEHQNDGSVTPSENVALFQALLAHGANPNARDWFGNTAMINEVGNGHTTTARLMLDQGADVNARGCYASTALMGARSVQSTGMIELLLERGAQVNARDKDGQTALMYACQFGIYRQGLERLLAAGADVNAVDREGRTALMLAVWYADPTTIQLLLDKGADVSARSNDGQTALMRARDGHSLEKVRLLRLHGAKE